MKESIRKLKAELKTMAKEIRHLKNQRKNKEVTTTGYVPGLDTLRWNFRHKHIAYCLLRGRKMEQIETLGENYVKPDQAYIEWIMKSAQSDSREKLYVVVDTATLNKSQQAVQAGHAVAEFLRKYPNTQWKNGTLVYLEDGKQWDAILSREKSYIAQEWVYFSDPDLPAVAEGLVNMLVGGSKPKEGPRYTAAAFFGPNTDKYFKSFKLL